MSEGQDEQPKKSRFGKEVSVAFFFYGCILVASFGNNVLIARLAGTEGRGLYALASSMYVLATPLLTCGLGQAATYFVGRGRKPSSTAVLNLLVFLLLTPICFLVAGGVYLQAGQLETLIATPMELALFAAAIVLPVACYMDMTRGFYLGLRNIVAFNGYQLAVVVLMLGLHSILLRHGSHLVLLSFVASTWIVGLIMLGAQLLKHVSRALPSREEIRESLWYGVRAAGITSADAGMLRLDYLVMAPFVGIADTAVYAIADQMTNLAAAPGVQAGKVMLTESANDPDGAGARRNLGISARLMLLFSLAASVVAVSTFWFLLPAAFGDDFAGSYVGVLLLLPCTFFKGTHALVSRYLAGRGHQKPTVIAGVAALVVDVALVLVCAPLWGWEAVAVARTIACAVQFTLTYGGLRRLDAPIDWRPRRADFELLWRFVAARRRRKS